MGGGKKENSPETDNLSNYARALFNQTSPLRQEFGNQMLEALKTGGIGAQLPIITRAVENSKGQLAQDLQNTQDNLSKYRLTGTPFGQNILTQARITGNQNIANIPTNYAQNFISQVPSFIGAMTGAGLNGMSSAAQAQTNLYSSYNNGYAQILSAGIGPLFNMSGQAIGGAAKAML